MKKLIPFLLLLLSACELVVEVNVPFDPTKIVVNALQRTDSTWYVELTHTKRVTGRVEYGYVYIPEATVVIHNPDGTSETLSVDQYGIFRGVSRPEQGETYKITVDAPNMGSAEAEMTVPLVVSIVDVKWDSTGVEEQTSKPYAFYVNIPFTVTFRDPQDIKNYYGVQVAELIQRDYQDYDGNMIRDTIWRVRENRIEDDPGIATKDEAKISFPDNTFDGQTYTAHFTNQFYIEQGETRLKVLVQLLSLSEDYYKYRETKNLQSDVMGDPFAQPVQVFSNVSSGFGIFAGNSLDVREWDK
jgi:hypothetical protein